MPARPRAICWYDQVEEDLIAGTNVSGGNHDIGAPPTGPARPGRAVYHYGIPLVIQDKTFVNDATTPPHSRLPGACATAHPEPTLAVDPLWSTYVPGTTRREPLDPPRVYAEREHL